MEKYKIDYGQIGKIGLLVLMIIGTIVTNNIGLGILTYILYDLNK